MDISVLSKENYVLTDAILFHVFIYSMSDIAGRNRRNREKSFENNADTYTK